MEIFDENFDGAIEYAKKKRGGNLKGRAFGSAPKKNLIKDPLLEPYYIKIEDVKAYTVMKEGSNNSIAYCTTFGSALKRIVSQKIDIVEDDTERTLKEYLEEYFLKLEQFNETITI